MYILSVIHIRLTETIFFIIKSCGYQSEKERIKKVATENKILNIIHVFIDGDLAMAPIFILKMKMFRIELTEISQLTV